MKVEDLKKINLPDKPGVYLFVRKPFDSAQGKKILYIGKATSLKDRVRSYFSNDLLKTRGLLVVDMVTASDNVEFIETDSVLEALVLEANLIKKHQPVANTKEKDNKSYNFVVITKEEFPRILIERGRSLEFANMSSLRRRESSGSQGGPRKSEDDVVKYSAVYGPFPSQGQLKEALNIIRKIFPFKTDNTDSRLYKQLGLEPDSGSNPESREVAKKIYKNNLRHIKLFFLGKKKELIKDLEKQMKVFAKNKEFEQAAKVRNQIFALEHIRDVSLIKHENTSDEVGFRIEAYDVAHMSGQNSVGVMTVLEDGEVKKSDYRKFILRKTRKGDDVGGLAEILSRRLKHHEWELPDLIVVDGGAGQRNRALKILEDFGKKIDVVSVVKNEKHQPEKFLGSEKIVEKYKIDILLLNNESHRFAIGFYRKKQRKGSLGN